MRTRDLGIAIGRGRPGPAQRHHGRRRRAGRARDARSRATGRSSSGGGRSGPASRSSCPREPGRLARAGLRRLPPAQRQRRADRPRVGPRVGDADDADRDHQHAQRRRRARRARRGLGRGAGRPGASWSLPVVGETYDGLLNDINGFHVRPEHLRAALASARGGPVAEGNVGGGTGMVCHEFKGGIGTASRVVAGGPRRLHGRRPGPGQLRQARLAAGRRRAGRRGDRGRRGPEPVTRRAGRRRRHRRRPARARSSSSSRPTRRCCPTSASGSPSAPGSASPAPAGPAATRAATCSSRSRPATDLPIDDEDDPRSLDLRRPDGRRRRHRRAVRRRHRGDRGGDHQRPGRRRDDDRARRHHRPRPAPRSAARGHGPLRAGSPSQPDRRVGAGIGRHCAAGRARPQSDRPTRTAMAAASTRLATPSLPRMFETWTPAVLSVMNSVSPIRRFERPCDEQPEHLELAVGQAERGVERRA